VGGLCPACLLKQGTTADTRLTGDSPRFVPPTIGEIAARFPQLEVLELIGAGGMGAVYKARQPALDRIVALKILPPGIGNDSAFAERFTREARLLARLNHPGIVTLFDFGTAPATGGEPPLYFFLMEYVDGVNLRQLMQTQRVSPREALAIVPQICDALQYAHDQGLVHRDIKPENLLMDRRGRVKIADFGLAKLTASNETTDSPSAPPATSLTLVGKVMGTPGYMAPEQSATPQHVDHRADIYALGAVFYELLTGQPPIPPVTPPSTRVELDVRLDQVVLRALETNPALRFQQASAFKTGVESATAAPPALPAGTPRRSTRRLLALGCGGLLLVLGGFVAISALWLFGRTKAPPATRIQPGTNTVVDDLSPEAARRYQAALTSNDVYFNVWVAEVPVDFKPDTTNTQSALLRKLRPATWTFISDPLQSQSCTPQMGLRYVSGFEPGPNPAGSLDGPKIADITLWHDFQGDQVEFVMSYRYAAAPGDEEFVKGRATMNQCTVFDLGIDERGKHHVGGLRPYRGAFQTTVLNWLENLNSGNYAAAWQSASVTLRQAIPRSEWTNRCHSIQAERGEIVGRTFVSATPTTAVPGLRDGDYWVCQFRLAFLGGGSALETVTLEWDGFFWTVAGYVIQPESENTSPAIAAAHQWLALADAGDYGANWTNAAPFFQSKITVADWSSALTQVRQPLGKLVARNLQASQETTTLPGAPRGRYVVMTFNTRFEHKSSAVETVTFQLESNGVWRASGYYIR
jgi:serine/threonine protein kinase